jgi:hypothetical protein
VSEDALDHRRPAPEDTFRRVAGRRLPPTRVTPFALAGKATNVDNGRVCGMRVRVSDPALLGDLQRYLHAAECEVEQAGDDALDVSIPRAPSDEHARREVAIYIQAWRAMNPGARAEIVA